MALTLEPMTKIRLACMHADVPAVLDALYAFGAIQVTHSRSFEPDVPLPSFEPISEALISLRSYEKARGIPDTSTAPDFPRPLEKLLHEFKRLQAAYEKSMDAEQELAEAKARESTLISQRGGLMPFRKVSIAPSLLRTTTRLEFVYAQAKSNPEEIRKAAHGIAVQFVFVNDEGGPYVLAAVNAKQIDAFNSLLAVHLGNRLTIPHVDAPSFAQAVQDINRQLQEVDAMKVRAQEKLDAFVRQHGKDIAQVRAELEAHAKVAELPSKFSRTAYLDVIEGWVPAAKFDELVRHVKEKVRERALVERIATQQTPPTKLSNPPLIRRFEFLVRFFSLPLSTELDPTLVIAITFPFIFGMILGDMGYGVLGVILSAFIFFKFPRNTFLQSISGMMFLSSVLTIVFGYIYGEAFGSEELFGYHFHPIIERGGEGITLLIVLSLLLGVVHLALGYFIGLVTSVMHRDWNHALAKLSWLVLEFSLVILAGLVRASEPLSSALGVPAGTLQSIAGLLALASFASILVLEGMPGVIEIPGLISNILSYLRIMALGLSGVILAKIINVIPAGSAFDALAGALSRNADPLTIAGAVVTLILFSVFFILGHTLAFVLGMFESSIQSLRLQYVEFFSKFYHGGGIPFTPLRETK